MLYSFYSVWGVVFLRGRGQGKLEERGTGEVAAGSPLTCSVNIEKLHHLPGSQERSDGVAEPGSFVPNLEPARREMPRSAAEGLFAGQPSRKSKSPVCLPKLGARLRRCLLAERQGSLRRGA